MKPPFSKICAASLCALLVAACAGDSGKYPSLAIRDVERVSGEYTPGPAVEPIALTIRDNSPDKSIAALVAEANASNGAFLSRAPSVRRLVSGARGSGLGSDARGNALIALADLTSLRSQTELVLADLDILIAERTNRLEPAADAQAAHAEVLQLVTEQDQTLSSLWGILGR